MKDPFSKVGYLAINFIENVGSVIIFLYSILFRIKGIFKRPKLLLQSMDFIGAGSIFIIALTALFTGMVFALQTLIGFRLFRSESLVSPSVAKALTRELAPVLGGLMLTGRVGSSITTELGTMRVTEQIDALESLSIDPVEYLVVPKFVASIITFPLLILIFDIVGIFGAWMVMVVFEGFDRGIFFSKIHQFLMYKDVVSGVVKGAIFGAALSTISSYMGFTTTGGSRGVGVSTTRSVVTISVVILILDYFITWIMF